MNRKSIFSALFALALIATACAKNPPARSTGAGKPSITTTETQTARVDPPKPNQNKEEEQEPQNPPNPVCQSLSSLAGTWTSHDSEKQTTLTGTATENPAASKDGKSAFSSKEVKTEDNSGKVLLSYDADILFDRTTCMFRRRLSQNGRIKREVNQLILSVKSLADSSFELQTRRCDDSLCTRLTEETTIFNLKPVHAASATAPKKEGFEYSEAVDSMGDANSEAESAADLPAASEEDFI